MATLSEDRFDRNLRDAGGARGSDPPVIRT